MRQHPFDKNQTARRETCSVAVKIHLCDNGLVLDRVECAGGVHQAAAHAQQVGRMQRDAQLQRVQAVAVGCRPAAPDVGRLAHRAIARAGHIAQHPVKLPRLALRTGGHTSRGEKFAASAAPEVRCLAQHAVPRAGHLSRHAVKLPAYALHGPIFMLRLILAHATLSFGGM